MANRNSKAKQARNAAVMKDRQTHSTNSAKNERKKTKKKKKKKNTKCKTKKRRPYRKQTAGDHQALQRKRNTTPDLITLSTGKQQQQQRSKRKQENRTRKQKSREEKTHTLLPSTKPHFLFFYCSKKTTFHHPVQ
jgi:hypothetical protein